MLYSGVVQTGGGKLVESALDQFTLGSEAINRIIPMLGK